MHLPERFDNVGALEAFLGTPSEALVAEMARLPGDLMILGAGGKVGPSMARRAGQAVRLAGVKKKVLAVDVRPPQGLAEAGGETSGKPTHFETQNGRY